MLVAVYIHAYVPVHGAGAETTVHDMLRALVERGHEVQVSLSNQPGPDYEIDGVKVHSYNGFADRRHPIGLAAKCDVMISHLECTQRATLLAHKYLRPAIQVIHNTHQLTTGNLNNADLAVFNSEWVKEHHLPLLSRQPGVSVVVRPMVDPTRYEVESTDERAITLVNMTEAKGSDIFYALAGDSRTESSWQSRVATATRIFATTFPTWKSSTRPPTCARSTSGPRSC